MNAVRLLEHYERIADSLDAIERMRRLIRNLAVRGTLFDNSATLTDMTLGELGTWGSGGTPLTTYPEYYGGNIPWLKISDLNDSVVTAAETFITDVGLANSSATLVEPGTILVAMYGSIGKLGIAGIRCATNQAIAFCNPNLETVTRNYLVLLLREMRTELLAKGQGVAQKNISQKILKRHAVRIPSLAQQDRVVAKVGELMAICDRIEAKRAQRETARDRLTSATLARLNAPALEPSTFADYARFAIQSLDVLTTRADQIKQLRETILSLAVLGKLVPQDPSDEPASELLKRIATARTASFIRSRSMPKSGKIDEPYPAPQGWQWARIGDVFSIRTGFAFKSSTYSKTGTLVFRVTNFDRESQFDLTDSVFYPTHLIDEKFARYLLESGEIIMVMVGGTVGKTIMMSEDILPALLNQNMWRLRSFGRQLFNEFEYLLIRSINQSSNGLTRSTHGHFAMGDYELKLVCIPPVIEQRRIVRKVKEMMQLCEHLEFALHTSDEQKSRLLNALIAEALDASNASELVRA